MKSSKTSSVNSPEQVPFDIVVATGNPGKLAELRQLLGPAFVIHSASELDTILPEETGTTFSQNAALKAHAVAEQTGLIAIADDSGLEVRVLNNAPGVYSARYAGPAATDAQNRAKLLHALEGTLNEDRQARFVSAVAVAFAPDDIVTVEGTCEGVIALEERGDGGFGYDSIFQIPIGKTMAELTSGEKNAISHRGQAMKSAILLLEERLRIPKATTQGGQR